MNTWVGCSANRFIEINTRPDRSLGGRRSMHAILKNITNYLQSDKCTKNLESLPQVGQNGTALITVSNQTLV